MEKILANIYSILGIHQNCLIEAILMNIHNIMIPSIEIKKMVIIMPLYLDHRQRFVEEFLLLKGYNW